MIDFKMFYNFSSFLHSRYIFKNVTYCSFYEMHPVYIVRDIIRGMYCGIQSKLKRILSTYGYQCLITFTQLHALPITSQIYRVHGVVYLWKHAEGADTHAIALG